MINRMPEDDIMCQTSEPGERLISTDDFVSIRGGIGDRMVEIFGYQKLSAIVFRLRSNSRTFSAVLNGEELPSTELLLGIHKITGVSIDWILTGKGQKYFPAQQDLSFDVPGVINAVDRFRRRKIPTAASG